MVNSPVSSRISFTLKFMTLGLLYDDNICSGYISERLFLKIVQATNSPFFRQSIRRDANERMVSQNMALIERVPNIS